MASFQRHLYLIDNENESTSGDESAPLAQSVSGQYTDQYYSEQFPYADIFPSHLPLPTLDELHLPIAKPPSTDARALTGANTAQTSTSEDESPENTSPSIIESSSVLQFGFHLLFFLGGIFATLAAIMFFPSSPAVDPTYVDALARLDALAAELKVIELELGDKKTPHSEFAALDGPELIARLESPQALREMAIWQEAASRRDKRISAALVSMLRVADDTRQVRALVALSAPFHAAQPETVSALATGLDQHFSPIVRAYATKLLAEKFPERAKAWLPRRVQLERDSFVLALTIRAVEQLNKTVETPQ